MTPIDRDDPLGILNLNRLSRLPTPAPDPDRAARVLDRCHRQLARQQRRLLQRKRLLRRVPEPAIIGALALIDVVAMMRNLLRWRDAY